MKYLSNRRAFIRWGVVGAAIATGVGGVGASLYILSDDPIWRLGCDSVSSAIFTADGDNVVIAKRDGYRHLVELWSADGRYLIRCSHIFSQINCIVSSHRGDLIAVACDDGVLHLLDSATLQPARSIRCSDSPLRNIAFSFDDHFIATCADESTVGGTVGLWESRSLKRQMVFTDEAVGFVTPSFSSDRKWLAACGGFSSIYLWRFNSSGLSASPIVVGPRAFNSVSFSPTENRFVAYGLHIGTQVWRSSGNSFEVAHEFYDTAGARLAKYSPEGDRIVTVGHRGDLRLFAPTLSECYFGALPDNRPSGGLSLDVDRNGQLCVLTRTDGVWLIPLPKV